MELGSNSIVLFGMVLLSLNNRDLIIFLLSPCSCILNNHMKRVTLSWFLGVTIGDAAFWLYTSSWSTRPRCQIGGNPVLASRPARSCLGIALQDHAAEAAEHWAFSVPFKEGFELHRTLV